MRLFSWKKKSASSSEEEAALPTVYNPYEDPSPFDPSSTFATRHGYGYRRRSIYTSQPSISERDSSLYPYPQASTELYSIGRIHSSYHQSTMNLLDLNVDQQQHQASTARAQRGYRTEAKMLPLPAKRSQTVFDHRYYSNTTASKSTSDLLHTPSFDRAFSSDTLHSTSTASDESEASLSDLYSYIQPYNTSGEESGSDYDDDTASTDGSSPCTPQSSSRATSIRVAGSTSSTPTSVRGYPWDEQNPEESGRKVVLKDVRRRSIVILGGSDKSDWASKSEVRLAVPQNKRAGLSKLRILSRKTNMASPVVPPRSALRTVPQPKGPTTPPLVTERASSLYPFPTELPSSPASIPSPQTPPESSRKFSSTSTASRASGSSGSGLDDDAIRRVTSRLSACKLPKEDKNVKKRGGVVEKDPNRIRDGRSATESASGVYTPTTFPGAQGPSPTHYPSHVYTPSHFQLYTSAGEPSRRSVSSGSTPTETDQARSSRSSFVPTNAKALTSKTMAGLRRISGQIGHLTLESRSLSNPTPSSTSPMSSAYTTTNSSSSQSARDSYFPPTRITPSLPTPTAAYSASSRQSSWGPVTPTSATFPAAQYQYQYSGYNQVSPGSRLSDGAGLGVGLGEKDGFTVFGANANAPGSATTPSSTTMVASGSKGKRKPVPQIAGEDDVGSELAVRA